MCVWRGVCPYRGAPAHTCACACAYIITTAQHSPHAPAPSPPLHTRAATAPATPPLTACASARAFSSTGSSFSCGPGTRTAWKVVVVCHASHHGHGQGQGQGRADGRTTERQCAQGMLHACARACTECQCSAVPEAAPTCAASRRGGHGPRAQQQHALGLQRRPSGRLCHHHASHPSSHTEAPPHYAPHHEHACTSSCAPPRPALPPPHLGYPCCLPPPGAPSPPPSRPTCSSLAMRAWWCCTCVSTPSTASTCNASSSASSPIARAWSRSRSPSSLLLPRALQGGGVDEGDSGWCVNGWVMERERERPHVHACLWVCVRARVAKG